jgi:hypothetical protein
MYPRAGLDTVECLKIGHDSVTTGFRAGNLAHLSLSSELLSRYCVWKGL